MTDTNPHKMSLYDARSEVVALRARVVVLEAERDAIARKVRPVADELRQALESMSRARARVAEMEAAARWIPVGERLPDEGVPVYIVGPEVQQAVAVYVGGDDPWRLDANRTMAMEAREVTHWRPLDQGPPA